MQGLGAIIRANQIAVGYSKFGVVGANGEGTPWLVFKRANNVIAPFAVKRVADGVIIGEHAKISVARRQVARLIREAS
jgi:hypothetical protein